MPKSEGTSAERVSVPRILADALLFGQLHKLPDPIKVHVSSTRAVDFGLSSRADLDAWHVALGCTEPVREQPFQGKTLCNANSAVLPLGYRIHLDALAEQAAHTALPAEALTVLDHIANPQPIVSQERAEEILNQLNNGVIYPGDVTLHTAIAWAREQADVDADHTGHCPGGVEVRLVDGTLIVWSPDFQRWEFAAGASS